MPLSNMTSFKEYPPKAEDSEDTAAILPTFQENSKNKNSIFVRHKKKCRFGGLLGILLILIGVGLATYFIYFHGRSKLHVFEFNVWGMPG